MKKELKIPDNISKLLEIGIMNWDFEQMKEFHSWHEKQNFNYLQEEDRQPEELPCFWQKRGLNISC